MRESETAVDGGVQRLSRACAGRAWQKRRLGPYPVLCARRKRDGNPCQQPAQKRHSPSATDTRSPSASGKRPLRPPASSQRHVLQAARAGQDISTLMTAATPRTVRASGTTDISWRMVSLSLPAQVLQVTQAGAEIIALATIAVSIRDRASNARTATRRAICRCPLFKPLWTRNGRLNRWQPIDVRLRTAPGAVDSSGR